MIRTSSPHIRSNKSSQKIMIYVLIALCPAIIGSFYFFGSYAAILFAVTLISTFLFDLLFQKITYRQKKLNFFYASSYVTGVLLYMVLPPTVPLWVPIVGVFVALGIGKYIFGYGNSIFNPALLGRAFLVVCFPLLMTTWIWPDGITGATPLAAGKDAASHILGSDNSLYMRLFFGNVSGCIGETSILFLLLGGLFLIFMKVIDWKIPAAYIGTLALLSSIAGGNPLFHVMAGGLMIGAFFMATDYGTIPLTSKGRMLFAFGCGLLTFIFRFYSSMPEGVMYSILLMNAAAPFIERYTKPKVFGRCRT
jgi:Na+-translocating ferredoxin:NAD+ oxidoreductase subunit D